MLVDRQLEAAGWLVQDHRDVELMAGQGVAVREVVMAPGHGRVDYLLYVDRRVVGVVETKPEGTSLSGVEWRDAGEADLRLRQNLVSESAALHSCGRAGGRL